MSPVYALFYRSPHDDGGDEFELLSLHATCELAHAAAHRHPFPHPVIISTRDEEAKRDLVPPGVFIIEAVPLDGAECGPVDRYSPDGIFVGAPTSRYFVEAQRRHGVWNFFLPHPASPQEARWFGSALWAAANEAEK